MSSVAGPGISEIFKCLQHDSWALERLFISSCLNALMIRTKARLLASASWYLSSGVTVPSAAARYLYDQSHTTLNRYSEVYRAWAESSPCRGFSTSVAHSAPNTRSVTFKLAQLGEGIAECELLCWHVKVISCFLAHMCCIGLVQTDTSLLDCGFLSLRMYHELMCTVAVLSGNFELLLPLCEAFVNAFGAAS